MRAAALVPLSLVLVSLAGCLDPAEPSTADLLDPVPQKVLPRLTHATAEANGTDPLFWEGPKLSTSGIKTDALEFSVELPADYWTQHDGYVEVSIAWPFESDARFELKVQDAEGRTIGTSDWAYYAATVLLPRLASGTYRALTTVQHDSAAYAGVVQVESRPKAEAPREIAPNLFALPPGELAIPEAYVGTSATPGCELEETVEKQARKCLRVSSALGNAGEGPLQVHLLPLEGAKAVAGLGQFTQRVFKTDGTYRTLNVGLGAFHPNHVHFHYEGLAQFTVYKYDVKKDERGEKVAQSRKNGFCFLDMGLTKLGLPGTVQAGHAESACLVPDLSGNGWITGISANWYDLYWNSLNDQYVDIHGVPDGVYEIAFNVNADKTLFETTFDDNEASTIFELKGTTVKELKIGKSH